MSQEELILRPQEPVGGRADLDHYPTPAWCTETLLAVRTPAPGTVVLDPSCGEGAILDVLQARRCRTIGLEMDPGRAGAARRAGHDVRLVDALEGEWPEADWLIGNPPYSHGMEFLERALAWRKRWRAVGVAFLFRLSFVDQASGRGTLFRAHPPDVLVLAKRPRFVGKGAGQDSMGSAWFCWPGTGRTSWPAG